MKIVLVGSGNIAYNLSYALVKKEFKVVQVVGRNVTSTKKLAGKIKANYSINLNEIIKDADLYFLAVNDSSIEAIINKNIFTDQLVLHLSGSVSIDVFKNKLNNYAVFYPLQTFSKNDILNFEEIPICLEASSNENYMTIEKLAKKLSKKVYSFNSEQRKILHLSAVFASNFVNHMYTISKEILDIHEINWDILKPLIKETAEKVMRNKPIDSQTGPAKRNDIIVINKQIELLANNPDLLKLYKMMSNYIINFYNKK